MFDRSSNLPVVAITGWIAANAVAFSLTRATLLVPNNLVPGSYIYGDTAAILNVIPAALVIGGILAATQWLAVTLVRSGLSLSFLVTTFIGGALGHFLAALTFFTLLMGGVMLLRPSISADPNGVIFQVLLVFILSISGLVNGYVLALCQSVTLRRWTQQVNSWIMLSAVGMGCGWCCQALIWQLFPGIINLQGFVRDILPFTILGIVYGLITVNGLRSIQSRGQETAVASEF